MMSPVQKHWSTWTHGFRNWTNMRARKLIWSRLVLCSQGPRSISILLNEIFQIVVGCKSDQIHRRQVTPEQGAEWAQNRGLIFLGIWPSVKSIYEAMRRMGPKYGTDLPRWSLELEPLKLHTLCEVRGEGVSKKVFLLVAPLALSMSSVKSIYINFGFLCVCKCWSISSQRKGFTSMFLPTSKSENWIAIHCSWLNLML